MPKAVILFGHGSRDPAWRRAIEAVAARAADLAPDALVRCAYLELDRPDLAAAVAEVAGLGASHIVVVPMFLGTGRHAREDLPALVEALRSAHPRVHFELQSPVGEQPLVVDLLARIATSGDASNP